MKKLYLIVFSVLFIGQSFAAQFIPSKSTDLDDMPASLSGNQGKVPTVKSDQSGYELITPSGGSSSWTDGSGQVTTTVNVGIKTTTPQADLDIRGELFIPGIDTAADCDGTSTTGVGSCESITERATLVSMGSNTLDFNNNGAADGNALCTDSFTTPTVICVGTGATCGATSTCILGSSYASATKVVDSRWGFKDTSADGLLDNGEDLYIDYPPYNQYYSTGSAAKFIVDTESANPVTIIRGTLIIQ